MLLVKEVAVVGLATMMTTITAAVAAVVVVVVVARTSRLANFHPLKYNYEFFSANERRGIPFFS